METWYQQASAEGSKTIRGMVVAQRRANRLPERGGKRGGNPTAERAPLLGSPVERRVRPYEPDSRLNYAASRTPTAISALAHNPTK